MLDEERANTVYNIYFCILIISFLHCMAIAFNAEYYDEIRFNLLYASIGWYADRGHSDESGFNFYSFNGRHADRSYNLVFWRGETK